MFVKTSRRRLTGVAAAARRKRVLCLRQGPLDVLPSLQPQALSPVSGLISGETDREPQKRRSQDAHEIISQVLPTGTLRRPTPSLTPIWLTAPTHPRSACPSCALARLPALGLTQSAQRQGTG